jgi:hypothetical protein
VRQGASWTAADHRQLTVAAVARPIHSSVDALGVLAAARSWVVLAQTASAHRSVQPVSRGRASSPCSTLPAGKPRRRSPLSSMRCPPIRSQRPGSGCPAVRCPVTWGVSSNGSGGRPSAVHPSSVQPSSVQPSAVHPCGVQPSAVCPCPSGRVRLLPCSGGGVGTRSRRPGDPDHRNRWGPGGCRAVDGSTTVAEAGTRATLPTSRWSVGGRWRTRAAGLVRAAAAALAPERPGRPGRVRSAPRGRLRGGHGCRRQREVAAPAAWPPSSGWGATTLCGRRRG